MARPGDGGVGAFQVPLRLDGVREGCVADGEPRDAGECCGATCDAAGGLRQILVIVCCPLRSGLG